MADTFTTKLGKTSKAGERTRIWLEGKRLTAHGFNPGDHFERLWGEGRLTLVHCTEAHFATLPRDRKGTVSGKADKPIIDVVGARVAETFKGAAVQVEYRKWRIVITD